MKTGKTLQELAAELTRRSEAKQDFITDTREATLLSNGVSELHIKGIGEFEVQPLAHQQIATHLKIPKVFYDRLLAEHKPLLDHNVSTLFRDKPARRMVRTLDGRARAFLSDRYRRLDNEPVAEAALSILGTMPDVEFPSCEVTDNKLYIKALLPRIQGEVNVGDTVQAGVLITNSEVGLGSVSVCPLIYRLICKNGMVAPAYGTKKYHVGRRAEISDEAYALFRDETMKADDRAFFLAVQDIVRGACDEVVFNQIVGSLRDLTHEKIEGNPVEAVERLSNRFTLTESESGSVLTHLTVGADLSAYGVLNALTRSAQDADTYDRSVELERAGGTFLELPPRERRAVLVGLRPDLLIVLRRLLSRSLRATERAEAEMDRLREVRVEKDGLAQYVSIRPRPYSPAEAQELADRLWQAADQVKWEARRPPDPIHEAPTEIIPVDVFPDFTDAVNEALKAIEEGHRPHIEATDQGWRVVLGPKGDT